MKIVINPTEQFLKNAEVVLTYDGLPLSDRHYLLSLIGKVKKGTLTVNSYLSPGDILSIVQGTTF